MSYSGANTTQNISDRMAAALKERFATDLESDLEALYDCVTSGPYLSELIESVMYGDFDE